VLRAVARDVTTDYAGWKAWNNQITLPTGWTMTRGGEKQGEVKVTEVVLNAPVPADAFKNP
jgi:hypothetical protein